MIHLDLKHKKGQPLDPYSTTKARSVLSAGSKLPSTFFIGIYSWMPSSVTSFLMRPFNLARNFPEYAQEFGVFASLQLFYQRNLLKSKLLRLAIKGIPTSVYCRNPGSDFAVLKQVIGRRGCEIQLSRTPTLIVDAGANVGYSSLFFANKWPNARIVAIEPDVNNCNLFRKNCGEYSRITLLQAALWHHSSHVQIVNSDANSWEFQVAEIDNEFSVPIKSYTIPDILSAIQAERISLLKIDIEGAERAIFSNGADKWLDAVDAILIELHDRYQQGCSNALENALNGRKYRRFRQGEYDAIILR